MVGFQAASVYSGGGYDAMEPEAPLPPTPAAVYEMHQQFTHQEYTSDQMDGKRRCFVIFFREDVFGDLSLVQLGHICTSFPVAFVFCRGSKDSDD